MRLYIIRHADPDYPNNTITAHGHREARALAAHIHHHKLTHLYCSPLGRAIDTMRYSADALKLEPVIEEWTQEWPDCYADAEQFGRMCVWDVPGEIIRGTKPFVTEDNWHALKFFDQPIVRERFDALCKNSDAFLARHGYERDGGRYRIVKPSRDRIAVFCHNGFGLAWLAHLLGIPLPMMWSGFWLPPTSVSTVLFDERSGTWAVPRCIGMADVTHLHAAGMQVTPHGIKANFH
jgi:probable phosphoglycerate mutase